MKSSITKSLTFADFEFDTGKRLLLKAGKPVALNSKTFDLLEVLIERRGEILSKDELLEKIWEGQFVEESNLTVQISTLRKLLGETRGENKYIATVPGKGYKFVGEVIEDAGEISIENHRYSRITVSDEINENDSPALITHKSNRKFSYILVSACVVLILLGAGFYIVRRTQIAPNLAFAQIQVRRLTNNGKVQTAALSPDGKQFAFVTDD